MNENTNLDSMSAEQILGFFSYKIGELENEATKARRKISSSSVLVKPFYKMKVSKIQSKINSQLFRFLQLAMKKPDEIKNELIKKLPPNSAPFIVAGNKLNIGGEMMSKALLQMIGCSEETIKQNTNF